MKGQTNQKIIMDTMLNGKQQLQSWLNSDEFINSTNRSFHQSFERFAPEPVDTLMPDPEPTPPPPVSETRTTPSELHSDDGAMDVDANLDEIDIPAEFNTSKESRKRSASVDTTQTKKSKLSQLIKSTSKRIADIDDLLTSNGQNSKKMKMSVLNKSDSKRPADSSSGDLEDDRGQKRNRSDGTKSDKMSISDSDSDSDSESIDDNKPIPGSKPLTMDELRRTLKNHPDKLDYIHQIKDRTKSLFSKTLTPIVSTQTLNRINFTFLSGEIDQSLFVRIYHQILEPLGLGDIIIDDDSNEGKLVLEFLIKQLRIAENRKHPPRTKSRTHG